MTLTRRTFFKKAAALTALAMLPVTKGKPAPVEHQNTGLWEYWEPNPEYAKARYESSYFGINQEGYLLRFNWVDDKLIAVPPFIKKGVDSAQTL